jgi:acetyl-CoA acetyltransferase
MPWYLQLSPPRAKQVMRDCAPICSHLDITSCATPRQAWSTNTLSKMGRACSPTLATMAVVIHRAVGEVTSHHSGSHSLQTPARRMVSREAQDNWALRSQQRFAAAQTGDHFKSQIVPVEVSSKKGPVQFDKDDHNRPDTALEGLARLKPAFRRDGTITAGNASGLNDAASAMVLADGGWADKRVLLDGARGLLRHCRS